MHSTNNHSRERYFAPSFIHGIRITSECSWILAIGLLLLPSLSLADDAPFPLTLHYFGTAGVVYVTEGDADFIRDLSQPNGAKGGQWSATVDSMAGAQANLQVNDQLEVIGQAVTRHRYDDTYTPELTWAFIKYAPRPGIELRGGRLGTDFYMRSDSRLVGYSNLTVRPSVDYYGGLPHQNFNGGDVAVTLPIGDGLLRGKVFGGISSERVPLENSNHWDVSGSSILGGNLDYQWDSWQYRLGYAQIYHQRDLPGSFTALMGALRGIPAYYPFAANAFSAAKAITVAGTASRHYSFGTVYDEGPLQVQLMISGVKHDSVFFQDSISGYLLAGYRMGDFTPYAGLSWSHSSPARLRAIGVPALDQAVSAAIGRTGSNQHTFTLGLRWDFRPGMDIKVQWDAIRGAPNSTFLYRWEQPSWNGETHVLSAALDFAF